MRKFVSSEEVAAARLQPWQHDAVAEAVHIMERIFGKGFDPEKNGYVVLVEQGDVPADAERLLGYPLGSKIEITWRRHGCLMALVLWGNSGDGVSFLCPERPGYAEDVQEILRREL